MHDLYDVARKHHVQIYSYPLEQFDSISMPYHNGIIGIDPKRITSLQHEKICLAHELGHCLTGSFYNIYSRFDVRQKHENRADRWAIRMLMPKDKVELAIRKGYTTRFELAEYFDVPEEFVQKALELYYVA